MKVGAVALIDVLGFRGIWKRHPANCVLQQMHAIKAWYQQRITQQFCTQPQFDCRVAFLSDTIAVTLSDEHLKDDPFCIVYLVDVLSWVLKQVLTSEIPMTFRGAISFGEYDLSENFLIGPAVDEAASHHECANGSIIWLTRDAYSGLRNSKRFEGHSHLVKFAVPLKDGRTVDTFTASPLEQAATIGEADKLIRIALETYDAATEDVSKKRAATSDHLCACRRAWLALRRD